MMLTFALHELRAMQAAAQNEMVETCAIGFLAPASSASRERFVVREFQAVPENAYLHRTGTSAVLSPEFCMSIMNRARAIGCGIVLSHTHPGKNALQGFSNIDDQGEKELATYFQARLPAYKHFACVITSNNVFCRALGSDQNIHTSAVGHELHKFPLFIETELAEHRYDRQVRAFGQAGQRALQDITIALVGLGGTGSVVAQELAHLGVNRFILIDPDSIDETNLNRLAGATPADIGRNKAEFAAERIKHTNSQAHCDVVKGDIVDAAITPCLLNADFIFSCTDSMASRALVNQFAYQYLVPCIDIGVIIAVRDGAIKHVSARAQMLSSGLACLVCTDLLDANLVRQELMTAEQRRRDPYIVGEKVVQPAVMSLNGTISSVAVSMFLSATTGFPANARMVIYDAVHGTMRPTFMRPHHQCIVCSNDGARGQGHNWALPVRQGDGHE